MKIVRYVSLFLALALAACAAWAYATFTVRSTADGFMVMYSKRAHECDEGGGCQILSEREFANAVRTLLRRVDPKSIT